MSALLSAAIEQHHAGNRGRAEALYREALVHEPRNADALHLLGVLAHEQGRAPVAIDLIGRALALDPTNADYLYNLGNALRDQGRMDEAVASYARAILADPGYAAAHYNLAGTLVRLGRLPRAVAAYRAALLAEPGLTGAYRDLAAALLELGRSDEAIAACRRGLAVAGDDPRTHMQLATALLLKGDLATGFAEYEWRMRCPDFGMPDPATGAPRWDGGPLNGRTILLHAEQGLGDTLHFVRYASLVEESGGRVVLACQPPLVSLLSRVEGVAEAVPMGGRLPPHSTWAPLLSLPRLMDTTLETVPSGVPYLNPRANLARAWAGRLKDGPGQAARALKVGLAWAGNPAHAADALRSTSLATLGPLARVPNVRFFALQKGEAGRQVLDAPADMPLTDLGPGFHDFEDTAAVVSELDLVITVDTSVAHLAGALGRPVWLLLTAGHDWRWVLGRDDTPWYPTMRLFRQGRRSDWAGLVERVTGELARLAAGTYARW